MTEDSPIGLLDAIKLVKECDPDNLMSLTTHPKLLEFFNRLNECGTDVLKDMGLEIGYSVTEFVQISTVMQLLSMYQNDFSSMIEVMAMASSPVFENAVILSFKSGIGLAVTEELR